MHRLTTARILLIAACLGSASSCGGMGGDGNGDEPPAELTAAEKIAALEDMGKLPKLDRSTSLAGVDADGNGIRDDIDRYISTQNYSPPQRLAAQQLAKATQVAVTVNPSDRAAVEAANLQDAKAVNCAFQQFPASGGTGLAGRAASDIEKLTVNTKDRLIAYLAFAKASDGIVLPSPQGNTCD